jgi:hypothetical protein
MNIVFSARWPHCTEVVVWALQHKDQWRENSHDLFLYKSPWWCTKTK